MYSQSTIKRARTILANADRQNKARASAAKRTVKAQTKDPNAWRSRPASEAQIGRIHRLEKHLGYRLSTKAAIGNAGQASDLYQSLKAEAR
jgi:hypothetical protein